MKIFQKATVFAAALMLAAFLTATNLEAQSGSKPKYSSGQSSSKPSTPSSSGKPKYTSPGSSGSTKPSTPPTTSKPKYTSPSGSSGGFTPGKPSSGGVSDKARAQKQAQSEKKYQESQKATLPPKPKYTSAEGKTVLVRSSSPTAEKIRSQPSTVLKPEVRQQATVNHIHHHHYSHDYNWYRSQPVVYVGGGYSSAFWYMMSEWSAERRARWLYHNRYNIEQSAYERGMRDAQVAMLVNDMEARRVNRASDYVDSEFANDPSLMYNQEYLEAVYNPAVVHRPPPTPIDGQAALNVLMVVVGLVIGVAVVYGVYALIFKVRWGGN